MTLIDPVPNQLPALVLIPGYYQSRSNESPTLADSLKYTRRVISRHYELRIQPWINYSFIDFWNDVSNWLFNEEPDNTASKLANIVDLNTTLVRGTETDQALKAAIAFLIEAAESYRTSSNERRSWAALVQCHFYFGLASGFESPSESASRYAREKQQAFAPLKSQVLQWLSEFKPGQFDSIQAVIRKISDKTASFEPSSNHLPTAAGNGTTKNASALLVDWSMSDVEVRAAFERVVGPIRRGRKPSRKLE